MSTSASLVKLFDAALAAFDEDPCPLLSYQIDAFRSYLKILLENEDSLEVQPKQRRSEKKRVRNVLADIFVGVGTEVFILCTIAIPVSYLSAKATKNLVPELRHWWRTAPRPRALSQIATQLCDAHSISTRVSAYRERILFEIAPALEQGANICSRHLPSPENNPSSPHALHNRANPDAGSAKNNEQHEQRIHNEDKSDVSWQNVANAHARAVAAFKSAISIVAESIPRSKEREVWISSCHNHLHLLKQLACLNESDGKGLKRKRGASLESEPDTSDDRNHVIRTRSIDSTEVQATVNLQAGNATTLDLPISQCSTRPMYQEQATEDVSPGATGSKVLPHTQTASQVEQANDIFMAYMAGMAELENILGTYLFEAMKQSCIRRQEENKNLMTFTDAARLHFAYKEGDDFKLELWLCSSAEKAISQAKATMSSIEDLRNLLGDFLFTAMKTSQRRKREEEIGTSADTSAVEVGFPGGKDSGDDCKLEVMLGFQTGCYIWAKAYRS
ncbi:hypothetical protein P154DRAFT_528256 [Amniculicola lignicola CBS 123094]|uniref:Uncharacterized protein n=1 Tax=Amniculicola lignicola CBS 123094 TaxID=1392246 RepID=A0A6A5VSD3_9PLEO|nr:hypothetical protein P154DRAFT_528256 [Amniculicola lignicola CBS 123094]